MLTMILVPPTVYAVEQGVFWGYAHTTAGYPRLMKTKIADEETIVGNYYDVK
jgi:hypothetical protein